jgi:pyruvate dehydrogenase E2 component (dihydrolipoamide acetyltransferase)
MADQVTLPRLGQGMEAGTIVRWLKEEGDAVDRDEPLYELDTEKVTQEVEAGVSGVLLKILVPEGQEVEVGRPIAVIGEQGEEVPDAPPSAEAGADGAPVTQEPSSGEASPDGAPPQAVPAADEALATSAEAPAPAPRQDDERGEGRRAAAAAAAEAPARPEPAARESAPPATAPADARIKASPLARRIAKERGIDLRRVSGTGPDGRIVAEDVERAAAAPPWEAKPLPLEETAETVPLTSVRRTIARRLTEAWQAPHFAISMTADMTRAIALRERLVELTPEDTARPTFSDVVTKLVAAALLRHPDVNAHYETGEVRRFSTVNVGLAVAIPNGLVVPVIHGCERLTIPQIAAARVDIVSRTRAGELKPEDLEGGTFTISNLGMYGVERFFAVLNPPQVAILAVGAIEDRVVAMDGAPSVRPMMEMTLSCDHRALDGATASEFLADVERFLEEPGLAL